MNQEQNTIQDAVSFIKESNFYKQKKYDWIRPLIDASFERKITEEDINSVSFEENSNSKESVGTVQEPKTEESENQHRDPVSKLLKINKLENIGLLNQIEPIEFCEGLNIFYGPNGVGKSSIYTSLCKCFGKNINLLPNLDKQNEESFCSISYVDDKGVEHQLDWKTGDAFSEKNVRIFDSAISNYIVDQDQINQFEIAHLKIEYFTFLHNIYKKIEDKLISKNAILESNIETVKTDLASKAPMLFTGAFELSKKNVEVQAVISTEELDKLKTLENNIKVIENNNSVAVIKNLNTAKINTSKILSQFGGLDPIKSIWVQKIDKAYFAKLNNDIDNFNNAQKLVAEANSKSPLKTLPVGWSESYNWQQFINSALDFLHTLEDHQKAKYLNEKCLLCQQALQQGSKELIQAYLDLRKKHEDSLAQLKSRVQIESYRFKNILDLFNDITTINHVIEQELDGQKIDSIDFEKIKTLISKIKNCVDSFQSIQLSEDELNLIQQVWDKYLAIENNLNNNITILRDAEKNRSDQLGKLKIELKPLKDKQSVKDNKQKIVELIDLLAMKQQVDQRIGELATLKQQTSLAKSIFSKEMPMQIFKTKLDEEYKKLGFKTPTNWSIKPTTRSDINKRVYSLGDKRLSEIFSEGERKVHSLADFFAESEMNDYKGIYIFDDPVNSLDEINMDRVALRILKLVEEGNQVIVFTHNMVFLNQLIETEKEKVHKVGKFQNATYIESNVKLGDLSDLKKSLRKINDEYDKLAANPKPDDEIQYELRSIYSSMSSYLESYLELILLKNVLNRFRPNIRMHKVLELEILDTKKLKLVHDLYKQTDVKSSRHAKATGNPNPKFEELKEHITQINNDLSS